MGEIQQLSPSHPSSDGMSCKTHLTTIICNELRWFFMELRKQQSLSGLFWGGPGREIGGLIGVEVELLGLSYRHRF